MSVSPYHCIMSVHSTLVDILTQIGRRVVRLEEKWNVQLFDKGSRCTVTDEKGGKTGFGVEHRPNNTIQLMNDGRQFNFEVTPNQDQDVLPFDPAAQTKIIQLSHAERKFKFDVNPAGDGVYTVDDGKESLLKREELFRAEEQRKMVSMRGEIERLKAQSLLIIETPEIVKHYKGELQKWDDIVWNTAAETSALRGLLAARKRQWAHLGAQGDNKLQREMDLLTSKLQIKTSSLSGICRDHQTDISVKLYKELDSFNKLFEELVKEKEYWETKKVATRIETYRRAIVLTPKHNEYKQVEQRITAEISKEVTDALTLETEEEANLQQEQQLEHEATPKVDQPTGKQLEYNIAEMKSQIATLNNEISQTLPSSFQKEFKAIDKLSDELIREHGFYLKKTQKSKAEKYRQAIAQETTYWEEQVKTLENNPFLILCTEPAQQQYTKLQSVHIPSLVQQPKQQVGGGPPGGPRSSVVFPRDVAPKGGRG